MLHGQSQEPAPVMVWLTDPSGSCTFLSPSWYEFTGAPAQTGLGEGWTHAIHPDDREEARLAFIDATEQRTCYRAEYRLRHHDGEYRWVIDAAAPRFENDGNFAGFIGSVVDITDRKQSEQALLEAAIRKDEFLATLAHELRNPLAPIRTALEVLKLEASDPRATARARAMMERQVLQMVRLIDDLLDVSRISRGKLELNKKRIQLSAVLHDAIEATMSHIERDEHRLSVTLPDEPIVLEGDDARLTQVFANLLNNAARYTDPRGNIWIRAQRRDGEVVVSVIDDGIGICAEMLPRVFDLFTQVDRSLERSRGGLGIGLNLVKRLVEMHGGTVEAVSGGIGKGSEFTVRLPVAVALEAPAEAAGPSPKTPPQTRRILIADDNADALTSLATLLELMGNEVKTARDGVEAVEIAQSFGPDVVLLDLGMPRLNGYDACRHIRSQSWGRSVSVFALSGWGQEEDKAKSRAAGFDAHLVKPVEPSDLEALLEGRR